MESTTPLMSKLSQQHVPPLIPSQLNGFPIRAKCLVQCALKSPALIPHGILFSRSSLIGDHREYVARDSGKITANLYLDQH